ncbi:MAG: J domain-containing protein [Cyanobacteria bacterium]|nr:J domain-containing protein [Cyanobacteriota bacterium]
MTTRDELRRAYVAFRLPPGSSWVLIKTRYKTLVKLLHPDKHGGEEAKKSAEEELKFYNEQLEVLRKHFRTPGEHIECGSCGCRAAADQTTTMQQQACNFQSQRSDESADAGPKTVRPSKKQQIVSHQQFNLKVVCIVAALLILGLTNIVMELMKHDDSARSVASPSADFETDHGPVSYTNATDSGITSSALAGMERDVIAVRPGNVKEQLIPPMTSDFESALRLNQSMQKYKHDMIMLGRDANTLKTRLRSTPASKSRSIETQLASKTKQLEAVKEQFNRTRQKLTLLAQPQIDDGSPSSPMPQLLPENPLEDN